MNSFFRSSLISLLLLGIVLSRPPMQRIVINNHLWEVPNEPGWEKVIEEAEIVRHLLDKCTTAAECRRIINELRAIFYRHSVSKQYLEPDANRGDDLLDSIFKWG